MAPYLGSLEAKFEHVPEFVVKKKKPKKKKKKKKKKDDDEASGIKSPEDD
jgi:hypothetical protein